MRFKPMKSSHRSTVENNRPVVFISASSRRWQWQAKQQGKLLASQSGVIFRPRSIAYLQRFAELKAQQWMVENNATDAPIIRGEVT